MALYFIIYPIIVLPLITVFFNKKTPRKKNTNKQKKNDTQHRTLRIAKTKVLKKKRYSFKLNVWDLTATLIVLLIETDKVIMK